MRLTPYSRYPVPNPCVIDLPKTAGIGLSREVLRCNRSYVMESDDSDKGVVDLTEAIEALRAALVAAWWDGQRDPARISIIPRRCGHQG